MGFDLKEYGKEQSEFYRKTYDIDELIKNRNKYVELKYGNIGINGYKLKVPEWYFITICDRKLNDDAVEANADEGWIKCVLLLEEIDYKTKPVNIYRTIYFKEVIIFATDYSSLKICEIGSCYLDDEIKTLHDHVNYKSLKNCYSHYKSLLKNK